MTGAGAGDGSSFPRLVAIMARLLAPDGCPWDREQTLDTLRPFLVEETYEVLDALEHGDVAHHREELGDLLMQVVFHAAIRQGEGAFTIDDVVAGICDKLVRRHPHIFGEAGQPGSSPQPDGRSGELPSADGEPRVVAGADRSITSAEVLAQWEEIKAKEKAAKAQAAGDEAPPRTLAGVPRGLPALARATKLGGKAGRVGFDWGGWQGSAEKVREEIGEVEEVAQAGGPAGRAHHEIGDLLFAVVNLARKLEVDAESALHDASARFTRRFEFIEDRLREDGRTPAQSDLTEMDRLWEAAKAAGVGVSPDGDDPTRR
ncbi:MAG TPA: nucleoside triphosphate pyrophosphohydrolase [Kofleriaceae bacterium]|nr:nucleoside triphosphate pyrophosphohydrolase [Kofleriaceae bacterium]